MENIHSEGEIIEFYEPRTRTKMNRKMSVGLQLETCRVKAMPSVSVRVRWTKGPLNLLEVWFGPDVQVQKSWDQVSSKVKIIVKT